MSFYNIHQQYNWEEVTQSINSKTNSDVERALSKEKIDLEDFKALLSPSAEPYIEQMAQLSNDLTQKRFGNTIQLYIPMYLSNECANGCIYCGFNCKNKITRHTLNKDEILKEVEIIKSMGFEHLLLVTGEHHINCGIDYIESVIKILRPYFASISVEIAPMEQPEYYRLQKHGLNTVYVYQETYHKGRYPIYHPKGKKSDFRYRLETPDRLGKAEIHRIGLGCLLGLEEWRTDSFFTALHLQYLEKTYWRTKYSVSFPRLRPHAGSFEPNHPVNDKQLVQLICAYRIFNNELEISISTRENSELRNHLISLGVTNMSAGSKTEPGGYASPNKELKQFETSDERSPREVCEVIKSRGYETVWKDWDQCLA